MSTTKIFLAAIAGTVVYFLLGWLIYGHLMMDFMSNHQGSVTGYQRSDNDMMGQMLYLVAGNLAQASLLAIIFGRWANITNIVGGLIGGGIVGLLTCAGFDCIMFATTNLMSRTGIVGDVVAFTVISAIAGGVIAWVLGMGKK